MNQSSPLDSGAKAYKSAGELVHMKTAFSALIACILITVLISGCVNQDLESQPDGSAGGDESRHPAAQAGPSCPESCDDGDECTNDHCSPATNFECEHDPVIPCCGNAVCERDEDPDSCPGDCSLVKVLEIGDFSGTGASMAVDGGFLYVGKGTTATPSGTNQTVEVYGKDDWELERILTTGHSCEAPFSETVKVYCSPPHVVTGDDFVYAGTEDGTIYVWTKSGGDMIMRMKNTTVGPDAVATGSLLAVDGDYVYQMLAGANLKIWDKSLGTQFKHVPLKETKPGVSYDFIMRMAVDEDNVYTGAEGTVIRILDKTDWSWTTREIECPYPHNVTVPDCSPGFRDMATDGDFIYAANVYGVYVLSKDNGDVVRHYSNDCSALSVDGDRLYCGHGSAAWSGVSVLDKSTFELVDTLPFPGIPRSIATDGDYVYVLSDDQYSDSGYGTIQIWEK